jgi:hypothetical protein
MTGKKVRKKEIGRIVEILTSKAYRDRQTEKLRNRKLERERITNSVIRTHLENAQLEKPIPIPPQYIPLIFERIEKPKRGRGRPKQAPVSPEQTVIVDCAFLAMRRLLRSGWSMTAAAEALSPHLHITRQAIVEAYRRGYKSYLLKLGWTPTEADMRVEYRTKSTPQV